MAARLGFYFHYLAVLYLSDKALRAPVTFPIGIPFPCNRQNVFPTINKTSLLNPHLNRTFPRSVPFSDQTVTQWAPQVEILSHESIGGFLSRCGWSSVLESLTKGVPIMAWPLYVEQWMNATFLTEEIGVAIRTLELPSKRVISREEVV